MARSDLLLSLVQAEATGDRQLFRKTTEAIIAEERAKQHEILADRLARELERAERQSTNRSYTATDDVAALVAELTPRRMLDDLILPEQVGSALRELIEEHQRVDLLRTYNLEPRHRVLLSGMPGNGKTSLAEALANELMVPYLVLRYEGVIGSYLGETAARLQRVFRYARMRPCVLFFDEFDTLGKERGDVHETGEVKRVVSSLLMQIDSLPSYVVVVTASNHPELLDRAVWRRFQLRLQLPPPKRAQIMVYMERAAARFDLDLGYAPRTLADKLQGASFSELEEFVADILRRRVLGGADAVMKEIVRSRLEQWKARVQPNAI